VRTRVPAPSKEIERSDGKAPTPVPPAGPRRSLREGLLTAGVALAAVAFVLLSGLDHAVDRFLQKNLEGPDLLQFAVDVVFVGVATYVVLRWRLVRRELAARAAAESALRESEERFSTLAGATTEAVALHDRGRILEVNDAFCRMFGVDRESAMGRSALEFVPPESKDYLMERITNPRDDPYEVVGLRSDGTRFPALVAGRSVPYRGRTVRVTSIRDLTREKRAAADLREAEELYRSLVEQIPAVTYIDEIDPSTESGVRSLYMSPQVEDLLGYAPEDFRDDQDLWAKVLHPADRDRALAGDRVLYETGRSSGHEYRLVGRDGRVVWVFDHGAMIPSVSGRPRLIQGVLVDITDRKRAEEALRLREGVLAAVATLAERLLSEPWEEVIPVALPDLGHAAGTSRVWISEAERDEGGDLLSSLRFEWAAPGIKPQIDNPELQRCPFRGRGFDDWAEILLGGGVIAASSKDLPVQQRTFLAEEDILSILQAPVFAGDELWGMIGFDDCAAEREWTPTEIDALKAAASTLGAAVARQRAERKSQEAEARYRTLVEQIDAVIYIETLEEEDEVLYISPQIEDWLGFPIEDWLGKTDIWDRQIHPEDVERVEAEDQRKTASLEPFVMDYRMIARDGRAIWLHEASRVVRDDAGDPQYWLGVLIDITDRKRAEEALGQAEARYRTLVEQIPAVLYLDRPDTSMETVYVSPQVERILGLSQQDWISDPRLWEKHIHPEDRQWVLDKFSVFLDTGDLGVEAIEYRMVRPDGRVVWVNERASMVRDEDGRRLALQGVMFDVTERRAAEEALREAEQRFRTLVEQIPAATYVWNSLRDPGEGDFRYVSPQVEDMLGISPERWMAEPDLWRRRVHPEDYDKVAEAWARTDRTGRPFDVEYRMCANDDSLVWVHDHAVVVERDEDGAPKLWQGVLFDITERKRHEQERQRLLTRLVQAQEEERRRIALDIHDDSVQKMTAVGLRLEALRNRVSDPDVRERMGDLEDIVGLAIRRLRHLLFELQPPALDKDGLAAALSQYLTEVGEEAELEPVLVNRLVEEPPIEVRTLAYRIAQEAVTNARKHAAARNLEVTLESRSGGIYVKVMDDGRGFPGESAEAPGHLGMLTMRERAELSGGWSRVSSQQGRGTTVEFWLPA